MANDYYLERRDDTIRIYFEDGPWGKAAAIKVASGSLRTGENLREPVKVAEGLNAWDVDVIPPQVLTLAEVKNGTGFARGTRFVVLAPGQEVRG